MYWQDFEPTSAMTGPWTGCYPAPMRDGRALVCPLREYGETAMAGLIANQASFAVLDRLCGWIAEDVAGLAADIVVGLPTLGHAVGAQVARALGHPNWVAPGTTRKTWYDPALSVPTGSVTAAADGRRMWLDPRLPQHLVGRRVLLVDDVISSGRSARAGLALLEKVGVVPVGVAVALVQSRTWTTDWPAGLPVFSAFETPVFSRIAGGWRAG